MKRGGGSRLGVRDTGGAKGQRRERAWEEGPRRSEVTRSLSKPGLCSKHGGKPWGGFKVVSDGSLFAYFKVDDL